MNALLRGTLTKSALPGGSSQILRARRQLQQDRRLREAKERRALASPLLARGGQHIVLPAAERMQPCSRIGGVRRSWLPPASEFNSSSSSRSSSGGGLRGEAKLFLRELYTDATGSPSSAVSRGARQSRWLLPSAGTDDGEAAAAAAADGGEAAVRRYAEVGRQLDDFMRDLPALDAGWR